MKSTQRSLGFNSNSRNLSCSAGSRHARAPQPRRAPASPGDPAPGSLRLGELAFRALPSLLHAQIHGSSGQAIWHSVCKERLELKLLRLPRNGTNRGEEWAGRDGTWARRWKMSWIGWGSTARISFTVQVLNVFKHRFLNTLFRTQQNSPLLHRFQAKSKISGSIPQSSSFRSSSTTWLNCNCSSQCVPVSTANSSVHPYRKAIYQFQDK